MQLSHAEILQALPHRAPMLLIDAVQLLEPPSRIVASKFLRRDEPCFAGHFPGHPIYPGVLIVEAIAQAAALLAIHSTDRSAQPQLPYLASVEQARFLKAAFPEQELELHVTRERAWGKFWRLQGEARIDGEPAATVALMATMVSPGAIANAAQPARTATRQGADHPDCERLPS